MIAISVSFDPVAKAGYTKILLFCCQTSLSCSNDYYSFAQSKVHFQYITDGQAVSAYVARNYIGDANMPA